MPRAASGEKFAHSMPESVFREELGSLDIFFQEVTLLLCGRRD
jgi:hypothetical protein